MISLLFDIEMLLSILGATLALGGFLFTLRHRRFYSVYARSSILIGGVSSFLHAYNFNEIRAVLEPTDVALACVIIQALFSLTVLLFTYTILRFKWKWQLDVSAHCSSNICPLKGQALIKTNK